MIQAAYVDRFIKIFDSENSAVCSNYLPVILGTCKIIYCPPKLMLVDLSVLIPFIPATVSCLVLCTDESVCHTMSYSFMGSIFILP